MSVNQHRVPIPSEVGPEPPPGPKMEKKPYTRTLARLTTTLGKGASTGTLYLSRFFLLVKIRVTSRMEGKVRQEA